MARVRGTVYLSGYARKTIAACRDAVEAGAEHVLGVSQELVPLREGPLQNSGRVVVSDQGRQANIYYDTVYARIQHEREDFRHAPGRQAHYLSQPLRTEAPVVREIMAAILRRAAQ